MNVKRFYALLLSIHAMTAFAADAERTRNDARLGAGLYISSDNEDFTTLRETAEYQFPSSTDEKQLGVRLRHHYFTQEDWSRNAGQVLMTGKGSIDNKTLTWEGEAGVLAQGGRQLLTMDATFHAALTSATSMEAFINRDYVETAAALDRGIHATYVGSSIEHAFSPHFTAVALGGYQHFSDGNDRKHGRLRLIYQPWLDLGWTMQYRFRYYKSDENETRRAYFNPERYRENMLMLGWRKRLNGATLSMLGGVGKQHIVDEASTPTKLLEATYQKTFENKHIISAAAGFNQSASIGGPDYKYGYARINWSMPF